MIFFLNGPPRCGKDLLAHYLHDIYGFHCLKFSRPLKEATHAAYGLNLPFDFFEDSKERPRNSFFGKSPRQAYIEFSEKVIKPALGEDFFGRVAASAISHAHSIGHDNIVFSDCGFRRELDPVISAYKEPMHLLRIHRPECDFSNDSRTYLSLPSLSTHDMHNNGSAPVFFSAMDELIGRIGL